MTQVGRGVKSLDATVDGSPDCQTSCSDPGLSAGWVFDLNSYNSSKAFDDTHAIPDGWSIVPQLGCNLMNSISEITDGYDYQALWLSEA